MGNIIPGRWYVSIKSIRMVYSIRISYAESDNDIMINFLFRYL